MIEKDIQTVIDKICGLTCSCKKDALWEFHQALSRTNAHPVELVTRGKYAISMKDVLGRLEDFEYDAPKGSSDYCSLDFKNEIVLPATKTSVPTLMGSALIA